MLIIVAAIKGITFKFDGHNNPLHAIHDAKRDFYCYYQMGQNRNPQYLDTFNNNISFIDSYVGSIGTDQELAK